MKTESVTVVQIPEALIEELKDAITEGVFTSRWELIKTYHLVGEILDRSKDELPKNYIAQVAEQLNQKERLIYQCQQFYRKFPELNALPQGKNISWHKIVNQLLPEAREDKPDPDEVLKLKIKEFLKVQKIPAKYSEVVGQSIWEWEVFRKVKK